MNTCSGNTCIVILGATGDLARRKLIPALYYLRKNNQLGAHYSWVGVAQETTTIYDLVHQACAELPNLDQAIIDDLIAHGSYYTMSLTNADDYTVLKHHFNNQEYTTARLFYCALPTDLFCIVTKNLSTHKIVDRQETNNPAWHRIVYEKPFGHDLQSAEQLNACLALYLNEHQIWRVDHYLSKDIVNAIPSLRFSNILLQSSWSQEYIDHVTIELSENLTIGNRGTYYDRYGTLKDVVQNHLLQLLALIAIEEPETLTCYAIAQAKVEVLKNTTIVDGVLGQYNGYREITGVAPASTTETFVHLKVFVATKRWQNVPFFLRAGKALNKHEVKIAIHYKPTAYSQNLQENIFIIAIEPYPGFTFNICLERPSKIFDPAKAKFCYSSNGNYEKILAHEHLLYSVLRGDHCSSLSWGEIAYSWKIIDKVPLLNLPLYYYDKDSHGPQEETAWLNKQLLERRHEHSK